MTRIIEPYLKLIGFGHLQPHMQQTFEYASLLADQVDKEIDSDDSGEMDDWYALYGGTKDYRHYHEGLVVLQDKPIRQHAQKKIRELLALLPKPEVVA